jgi:hypothetical protein
MPFLHWFKRKSEVGEIEPTPILVEKLTAERVKTPELVPEQPRQETPSEPPKGESPASDPEASPQAPPLSPGQETGEIEKPPAEPQISIPIGAFYAALPVNALVPSKPDLTRTVQIHREDMVINQETQEATLPLSILSLSCPEIFVRAVEAADDIPVTFSLKRQEELKENLEEIHLRLQPILSNFPPDLEPPLIHTLLGTEAEIALPLHLIQSQLASGRVVIPGGLFCKALPDNLKPHFAAIDPAAEIPIPLQEIFSQLPAGSFKVREDQESDVPDETIATPFTAHAEEDARRFNQVPTETAKAGTQEPAAEPELPGVAFETNSENLQAIFMTEEPLDLTKTIQNIAELPGLKSCILSTTDGLKLAGDLGDAGREKTIFGLLPDLFRETRLKLEALRSGPLETITLYYGTEQLSTFVQGKLCLTVLHDNRPFKPGVREKIQAVVNELQALSSSKKPL